MAGAESESRARPGEGWKWAPRIDSKCGDPGLFVNQDNEISVVPGEEAAIITGMRIILNNDFAWLPVCGHTYATAQFMGTGATEFSMQIAGIGDHKISRFQAMHEQLEENARLYRKFNGAGRVRLSGNEFLRLAGIYDGIISSIDTQTDQAGTDLYRCQISFTSDGHHTEGFGQEMFVDLDQIHDIVEGLLGRVNVTTLSPEITASIESDEGRARALRQRFLDEGRETGEALGGGLATDLFGGWGLVEGAVAAYFQSHIRNIARSRGFDPDANVTSVDGMLEMAQIELSDAISSFERTWQGGTQQREVDIADPDPDSWFDTRMGLRNLTRLPIRTPAIPESQDIAATFHPQQDLEHPWLQDYVQQVCDVLTSRMNQLPPITFFRGPARGHYWDYENRGPTTDNDEAGVRTEYDPTMGTFSNWPPLIRDENAVLCRMIYGRKKIWSSLRSSTSTGRNVIETSLFGLVDELQQIAQVLLSLAGQFEGFDEVFSGATERWTNSPRTSAHPTYPDLGLPPHPVSGLVIDTEPDFYFFNDGEEGLLNEVGPDVINEIDYRLRNCERSFARLSGGEEWSEHYLGRSRLAADYNANHPSLDPRFAYRGIDGSTAVEIDPTTAGENAPTGDAVGWGPPEGRPIGGGEAPVDGSVVEQVLAMSPSVMSSNAQDARDLSNYRRQMMRRTSFSLPEGNPGGRIGIGAVDSVLDAQKRKHSFARNALQSIVEQSIAQAPEETLTMRRAFPSFKIYFIEDDTGAMREHLLGWSGGGIRPIMYFDDLYNYNSVKSIRLIRSRKNPADLLVLSLTNVQGLLERRTWAPPGSEGREIYSPGFEDTEMENPLKKLILKEGLKVQARLGYTNDPNKMGNKFVGEVVEVSYNAEVADEVTIICQSYGAELVLEPKGVADGARDTFVDTPDLLHTLMCSPELVHFGRFEVNPQFNPGEARSAATSRNDPSTGTERNSTGSIVQDPRVVLQGLQELLTINRSKWIIANNPSDDNIFAPGIRDHLTAWERFTDDVGAQLMWNADWVDAFSNALGSTGMIVMSGGATWVGSHLWGWLASGIRSLGNWLNDGGFSLTGQTIWETLKEMELRHPGWVAAPRPYGTRNTLFFGVPSHRYWADEISREEMLVLGRLRTASESAWASSASSGDQYSLALATARSQTGRTGSTLGEILSLSDSGRSIFIRTCREMATNRFMANVGEYVGATLGRFRPFRRYHLLTSDHHILMNNIRASNKGTFNAVTLQYGDGNYYTMKADDSIPDELTRVQSFSYRSCDNETLARRYCIGLLVRHLKDVYKGEVVVTGMDIDPYDACYIHDDRLGMYGTFEVEQVVDTFTPQTGWITEITPDLWTGANEWSTRSTADARAAVIGTISQRYMGHRVTPLELGSATSFALAAGGGVGLAFGGVGGLALGGGVVAAGAALAWIGGYQIVRWTQDRQPLWVCPLILGERPYFAGLDGFRQDGFFASVRGELHSQFDAVREGWRRLHMSSFANDITVGLSRAASGQGVVT